MRNVVMDSILIFCISVIAATVEAQEEFMNANNLFATTVYKELLKSNETNILVSPLSAEMVLAFTQSGCKGETAEELRNALHLPNNKDKIESDVKAVLSTLKGNEQYSFLSANKMYVGKDFSVKEEFKNVASTVYQADLQNIDFSKRDEAVKIINTWVEEQTAHKIQNLISPNDINPFTAAILINALYFKGEWSNKFNKRLTFKRDFYKSTSDVTKVDTMHHYETWFKYYESTELNAKFLEIPFEGQDVSMTFVLPNEIEGLASLEKQIDKVFSAQMLTLQLVDVAIPKFKIESTIDFRQILENVGVKKLFSGNEADLSGIAGEKGSLVVSEILQKTFINLEEGGVEAAAATVVLMRGDSAYDTEPKKIYS